VSNSDLIDLLRSLSIIEGAVCTADRAVQETVNDELGWCVDKILEVLKEQKK